MAQFNKPAILYINAAKFVTCGLFLLSVIACKNTKDSSSKNDENQPANLTAKTTDNSDSASITRWDVIPAESNAQPFSIIKDSGLYWKIKMPDGKTADADLKTVGRSLKHLAGMKNMESATLDLSKWKEKGIDDDGTKLVEYKGNQKSDSFLIGKLVFLNQTKSSHYIRRPGSDKVFLLKSVYLEGSVLSPIESFRKREMVSVDMQYFKRIRIVTPGSNEYYLIEKVHDKWTINGQDANQDKVIRYAKMLTLIQIPDFANAPHKGAAGASLRIETTYGPVELTAKQEPDGSWIMASSVNLGNYLKLNTAQVNAIFPSVNQFVKQ
jgi:hypothetical protein